MEVSPQKKSKREAATSGVIIIDPAAFPEKKLVPPKAKEQYLLPPHNKNFTLKTTKPAARKMVRILPKLSNTPTPSQAPQSDNAQNRNLKDLTVVTNKNTPVNKIFNLETSKPATPTTDRIMPTSSNTPTMAHNPLQCIAQNQNSKDLSAVIKKIETPQAVHTTQLKLPKHMSLQIKPVKQVIGGETLLNQPTAQPNQQAVKYGVETLLKQPIQSAQKLIQLSHSIKSVKILELQQQTNQSPQQANKPLQLIRRRQPLPKQPNLQTNQSVQQTTIQQPITKQPNIAAKPQTRTAQGNLDPGMQYIEFINEALFDYEEISKKQVISVAGSDDDDDDISGVEEKTLEYLLQIRKTHSVATETQPIENATIGVQTDQADDDRVYCGFVNVTKDGPEKYFNLRCFYCEAEYPISFYAEFSEHIIGSHGDMEKIYVGNDSRSTISEPATAPKIESEPELNLLNDSDSSDGITQEELPPVNLFADLIDRGNRETELTLVQKDTYVKELLPEDFDDGDETGSASEGENYYLCVEKYDPNIDHSYSQSSFNKASNMKLMSDEEPVDEITFIKTAREIVMDFLEHLRGFHSLWRDRSLATASYDNELLDLMDIMIDKWGLNLKRRRLRKNLENIKAWYVGMTVSKEELGNKFYEHKFIEYFNKCAEYLPSGDTSKLQKVMCDVCDRFCYNSIGLQLHKWRKHKIGRLPYECNRCNKRFDVVYKLRNHLRTHRYVPPTINQRPSLPGYTCVECNEKFSVWDEFKKHLEIHPKGDCPYLCLDCGHRFKTTNLRSSHQRRHEEPAYPCDLCPKKFYFSNHLKQHIITHNGNQNFVCEWCGKTFTRQTRFKEHLQYAHYGRGFCKICNRHYHKSSIFSKHLRTMHRPLIGTIEELTRRRRGGGGSHQNRKGKGTGPRLATRKYTYVTDPVTQKRRILCPKCDKSYNQYDSLYAHYKKVHGSRVQDNRRRPTANQKLSKARKKHAGEAVSNTSSDSEAEAEATAAVNSITKTAATQLYNPVDKQNTTVANASTSKATVDNKTSAKSSIVEVQIKNEKNITTTISFEKFVDEIAMSNNFALQSPNITPPLLGGYEETSEKAEAPAESDVKSEGFEVGDYEFLLNSSSGLHFS